MIRPANYTGSLGTKLVPELKEIARALGVDAEQKKNDLKEAIQAFLDDNETEYSSNPQFKGLYGKRRYVSLVAHSLGCDALRPFE